MSLTGITHLQGAKVAQGTILDLFNLIPMQEEEAEPREPCQSRGRK